MANNTLAIRFTENEYATKAQVAKELRTNMVDSFWTLIKSYRASFEQEVALRTITNKLMTVCFCPSTNNLLNSCEVKNLNTINQYNEISKNQNDLYQFEMKSVCKILQSLGEFHDFTIDENYLRMLLTNSVRDSAKEHQHLVHYKNALTFLKTCDKSLLTIDTIAEMYSTLTNNFELTGLYRTSNLNHPANKVLINRLYDSAPYSMLNEMMDSFITYINEDSASALVKTALTVFYINYIKPFDRYNEEMSILLAKWVLLSKGYGDGCAYLNLERIFYSYYQDFEKMHEESQKADDLTYFLRFFIIRYSVELEEIVNIISNVQAEDIKNDYYADALEEAKEIQRETQTVEVEPEEEIIVPEVEEVKENITRLTDEQKENIRLGQNEMNEPVQVQEVTEVSDLAVGYVPQELDEETAKRVEADLLENDPELRRGQAYFFARHCILGKRYTIQQYKRALNCAYETARSSMENLTKLGYYRQEMVKNKKVYTPIKRK